MYVQGGVLTWLGRWLVEKECPFIRRVNRKAAMCVQGRVFAWLGRWLVETVGLRVYRLVGSLVCQCALPFAQPFL